MYTSHAAALLIGFVMGVLVVCADIQDKTKQGGFTWFGGTFVFIKE